MLRERAASDLEGLLPHLLDLGACEKLLLASSISMHLWLSVCSTKVYKFTSNQRSHTTSVDKQHFYDGSAGNLCSSGIVGIALVQKGCPPVRVANEALG